MKKVILLLSLFVCSRAFAQGNLILFTEQGEKMWVILNGIKQNAEPQTNVKVTNLNAPNYKLKIIFEDKTISDLDKNVYLSQPDIGLGEYTYNIKKNKDGKYVLRPVSAVPIAQALPPAQGQVVIVYTTTPATTVSSGTVTQQTTTTTTTGTGSSDNVNMNMGMNVDGVGMGININVNDPTINTNSTVTQTTTTTTTTTGGGYTDPAPPVRERIVYVQGYNGPYGCPMPMDPGSFSSAKESIANTSFESTKQDMAKSIIGNNCFTTDQVIEILQLFDFESTKLEIAKFAYSHTYDKGNYYKVNNVFDFDSSKSDLTKFTSTH